MMRAAASDQQDQGTAIGIPLAQNGPKTAGLLRTAKQSRCFEMGWEPLHRQAR